MREWATSQQVQIDALGMAPSLPPSIELMDGAAGAAEPVALLVRKWSWVPSSFPHSALGGPMSIVVDRVYRRPDGGGLCVCVYGAW
jgi:hypothetical protein